MFKKAIVKIPCPNLINGLTTANLGIPDFNKAINQHKGYIDGLRQCGLAVKMLEADNEFPDSTFIEDIALCTPFFAVITNPGAKSRAGETRNLKAVLNEFYTRIYEINPPGTLDAGDVMMAGQNYYIGISERTNEEGASQLCRILRENNLEGIKVPLKSVLHLKTGVSYLENNNLLVSGEFVNSKIFENFNRIVISPVEAYAANSLWINGKVLVPDGFPEAKLKIEQAGYETIPLDVSEFQKIDGGLSCLSLRF
jgi:dimethylargininase